VAMEEHRLPKPDAVGHRLVHGGPNHMAPEKVTPELANLCIGGGQGMAMVLETL